MNTYRDFLEASRDSRQASARHDRGQFVASLAISAMGIALAGAGVGTVLKGDFVDGALEIITGASIAIPTARIGLSEVQDYADTSTQVAIRQQQIDRLGS